MVLARLEEVRKTVRGAGNEGAGSQTERPSNHLGYGEVGGEFFGLHSTSPLRSLTSQGSERVLKSGRMRATALYISKLFETGP